MTKNATSLFRTVVLPVCNEKQLLEASSQHIVSELDIFSETELQLDLACWTRSVYHDFDLSRLLSDDFIHAVADGTVSAFGACSAYSVQLLPSGKLILVYASELAATAGVVGENRHHNVESLRAGVSEAVVDLLHPSLCPVAGGYSLPQPDRAHIAAMLRRVGPCTLTVVSNTATGMPAAPAVHGVPRLARSQPVATAQWPDDMHMALEQAALGQLACHRARLDGLASGPLLAAIVAAAQTRPRFLISASSPDRVPYGVGSCRHPAGCGGGELSRAYGPGVILTFVCKRDEYS
ncbi:hypothetical protein J8273_0315 [Carpediemonas membranifera]|uniref:Uncharacterized protein n=1 Tax=Carpediemonas membranifera TaxID=201153 RepID=A0A8J6BDA8_9EUKA|nr:hypothetical protein J8273_0315 [Carpediemonas membranifera]|eukprot:KAG9395097.1 hypothetical protein J8273_0315 [Carpediemonas membranifera]